MRNEAPCTSGFFIGIIAGFAICGMLTFMWPRSLTAVNQELLEAGLAHRDCKTGYIIWNDITNYKDN